jgi:lipoprotein NlpD
MRQCLLIFLSVMLFGCYSSGPYAPVKNLSYEPPKAKDTYVVKSGDTLYSIAWMYGLDYRALAQTNQLAGNYIIHPGQALKLKSYPAMAPTTVAEKSAMPVSQIVPKSAMRQPSDSQAVPSQQQRVNDQLVSVSVPVTTWQWPARGKILQAYGSGLTGNKGVDIAGKMGESVLASAPGVVVYSGAGVRGYGNLIIIKHNNSYLSAYAFNQKLLARLGERVSAGQKIALMGRNNAGETMLHFEIRRNGQSVNPLPLLR